MARWSRERSASRSRSPDRRGSPPPQPATKCSVWPILAAATEGREFTIYADWNVGEWLDAGLLARIDAAWPHDDEAFCSSPADHDPQVLTLSFGVRARSIEEAASLGMAKVQDFRRQMPLPGRLMGLQASDEEGDLDVMV